MLRKLRDLDGAIIFVVITVALTLSSAVVFMPDETPSSMLHASIIYVAVVGWQPLVAFALVRLLVRETNPFDHGVRTTPTRDTMRAIVVATFVLAVTLAVEAARGNMQQPPEVDSRDPLRVLVGFAMLVAVLWLQSVIEELAWRGYVLPRLMRTLGPWPGLVVHGLLWGLCYSPLFAIGRSSVAESLQFAVTCSLLGIVLGWLRLSTRSIYTSAAMNATLTLGAGLPLLLFGTSSRFSAVFEPAGWISMVAATVAIACYRPWRTAIAIPYRR